MDQNTILRTKIGKLISGTRKPDEGFAEVFAYEPKDFLEKQHGNVYFVVEVASGSNRAVEVGETVINAIRDEFYDDLNRNVILSFESALRKANEELSDLTSAGETDWIGKLNVVCAVISEDKLHLAKVGETEAYISRGEKITRISEDAFGAPLEDEKEAKHPMKTFSTITSGKLQPHDKILLSTSELFSHISLSGIKKIISENSPAESTLKLKELLKDEEGIGSIGTLVIEMVTELELSEERGDEIDEIWIEEPSKKQTAKNIVATLGLILSSFFSKIKGILAKIAPKAKQTGIEAKRALSGNKAGQSEEQEIEEGGKKEETKEIKSKPKKEKQESFISFARNYFKKFSFENFIKDVKKAFSTILEFFKKKAKAPYIKYLAGAFVLIAITGILLVNNYYTTKNKNEANARLNEAIEFFENAENALIYQARKEAKDYLISSKNLVSDEMVLRYFPQEVNELLGKIDTKTKEADGIFEIPPDEVVKIENSDPNLMVLYENKVFAVEKNSKEITIVNAESGATETKSLKSKGNIVSIAIHERYNNVILYTDQSEVFEMDTKSSAITEAKTAQQEFKKGKFLTTYFSNMYIVSPEQNQIYRYTKTSAGFSYPSNYITSNSINISDAVSVAIPGTVLVLEKSGNVIKLVSGAEQEFSISGLTFNIENPLKIINTPQSSSIYIIDNKNGILVFDNNGAYIKTISPEGISDIKDAAINEEENTAYILAENKVYKLAL